jgi:hypothetical protein
MALEPRNHQEISMNYVTTSRTILATLAIASLPALAQNYTASFNASGDPQRWYQPLVTPRQKYDNAMLEARNALADALRDCRRTRDERAACEATARSEYQDDVAQAKVLLASARRGE